jgi:protein-tyrosine-phosphatase
LAKARGFELANHRSRVVDAVLASQATLLVVMTTRQAHEASKETGLALSRVEVLGDLDPRSISQRDIPDPYGQEVEVFEEVFDRIDRCLTTLVRSWEQ